MIRLAALAAMALVLGGCDGSLENLRNSPPQQVEDFATCKAGGMEPYQTMYGEILCAPPKPAGGSK